jgi:hypothetical protein
MMEFTARGPARDGPLPGILVDQGDADAFPAGQHKRDLLTAL